MRFELLRLPNTFVVRFETHFDPLPGSRKVTDGKNRDFLFFQKMQLKGLLFQIHVQKLFQLGEVNLGGDSWIALHSNAANLIF